MAVHSARRHAVVGVADHFLLTFLREGPLQEAVGLLRVVKGLPNDARVEGSFHQDRCCWFVVSSEFFTDEHMQDNAGMLGLPLVKIEATQRGQ